jgi:hypothetical protein
VPGCALIERTLAAPLDDVWAVATGFEAYLHRFEHGIRAARILARQEESIDLWIRTIVGLSVRMEVTLRPGWCWMATRRRGLYVVGMAAVSEAGQTRFAHLEGMPLLHLGRVASPLIRWQMEGDLQRIEALAQERGRAAGG